MNKKKLILIPTAALLLTVACGAKTQHFSATDGSVTATLKPSGRWTITDSLGHEPVPDYDSMRVTEVGDDGHPMTVIYYRGKEQHIRQYYTNMQLRCQGMSVDGLSEGRWIFYHSNGNVQSECTFLHGRENGPYRVMRENGAPYYIGQYTDGQPTGVWEIYDPDGNLVGTKEY